MLFVCVWLFTCTVCVYGYMKTLELADLQELAGPRKQFSADNSLCMLRKQDVEGLWNSLD